MKNILYTYFGYMFFSGVDLREELKHILLYGATTPQIEIK